jgi:hypothetical protein
MSQFAVILLAQPDDLGRAVHGLLYSKDFKQAGHQVQLVFDGGGATWIGGFEKYVRPHTSETTDGPLPTPPVDPHPPRSDVASCTLRSSAGKASAPPRRLGPKRP